MYITFAFTEINLNFVQWGLRPIVPIQTVLNTVAKQLIDFKAEADILIDKRAKR